MRDFLSEYKLFLTYVLLLFTIFFISRFALVNSHDIEVGYLFCLYSLRMDTIVVSSLLLLPILFYTFNMLIATRIFMAVAIFLVAYLEIANFFFFEEFNTRLNYLFIEYLEYPEEVFDMIWKSYSFDLLTITPILFYLAYNFFRYTKMLSESNIFHKLLFLPLLLILLFIGMRSSFDSSTPNQSFYSFSNSTLTNDITNNTIFSLLYAVYLKSKEGMPSFGKEDKNSIANIKKLRPKEYIDNSSLLHFQKSTFSKKKRVVLTLLESCGSSYIGSIGGTPTSPYFDKMAKEGLFLSNMYSSSNRSNRGFEAVLGSLFPIYANTYLKLPKSQSDFWTIARTMKKSGYKTVFLYGGDSKFDNMKGFALNNGFDEVIDKYDFDKSIKRYTWGVCDEELYKKANRILHNESEPIFLVMFSLSSHKPFDYPENKIDYYKKEPIESFANSVKYADYALYEFYKNLKGSGFFNDGVLAVVADHNAHMFGDQKIPVNEFKIPALFIASDLEAKEIDGVTHQIDMAPTLLDIAGVDANIPAMGVDLTKSSKSSALIIHRGAYAYLKGSQFVLYRKNKKPISYDFNYKKLDDNESLISEGLNYIYGSYKIYDNQLHKDKF